MWLEAIVPREDLAALLAELTPVTIRLGESGELCIHEPSDVTLVQDLGLRFECKARLEWEVLGLEVPVTASSVGVLVRPLITHREGRPALVFALELEHTHVAGVPSLFDARVTGLVNRELEGKHVELAWAYGETLSHVFDLPVALAPRERLSVTVDGAKVKATGDALGLAIQMRATVLRGPPAPVRAPSAAIVPVPAASALPSRRRPRRGRTVGLVALAALAPRWGLRDRPGPLVSGRHGLCSRRPQR